LSSLAEQSQATFLTTWAAPSEQHDDGSEKIVEDRDDDVDGDDDGVANHQIILMGGQGKGGAGLAAIVNLLQPVAYEPASALRSNLKEYSFFEDAAVGDLETLLSKAYPRQHVYAKAAHLVVASNVAALSACLRAGRSVLVLVTRINIRVSLVRFPLCG
jgi:hypothetical protein